jgi:hypothetical protein
MRASPFRTIASAFLLLLAACATDGPSVVAPPDDAALARETGVQLVLVSGGGQTGMVGHPLPEPVVVRVLDQEDRPVADARVNFIPPSDGAVDPRQARTDAEGYARATWMLGSLGEQVLRVSGTGGTLLVTATAYAGGGTEIALLKTAGDEQTGAPGTLLRGGLQVRVLRDDGTPVQGAVLSWAVASGGGSLDAAVSRSSGTGYSVRRWTLGPDVGTQSVTVSTPGAEPVTFTAQALNAVLEKAGGDGQAGAPGVPLARAIQVRATRADGSPAAGIALTWTVASGGGSLVAASARTSAAGTAQARWTLGAEFGVQTVTVSAPGAEPVTFTATAQGLRLEKSMGDGQTAPAGTLLRTGLRVRVTTASGIPVPGVPITWTVSSGGGSLDATESRSSAAGYSVRRWTLGPRPGEQTVTVSTPGAEPVVFTATATGGSSGGTPVSMHVIPDPMWLTPGDTARLRVVFLDAEGNLVPGPRPTFQSLSNYASVDGDGLVRSLQPGAGAIEVRAWPFREFASVNPWTYRERYGAPRQHLYVLPEDRRVTVGERLRLTGLWVDADGRISVARDVRWSALSPNAVGVSADGWAEALRATGTRVYAEANGKRAFATIGVWTLQDDWTAPLLDGVTIEPLVVDVGAGDAQVTFTAYGRDDGPSGLLETLEVQVTGPDGRAYTCRGTGSRCTITIPRGSAAGTYALGPVRPGDKAGNARAHWVHVYGNRVEAQPRGFTVVGGR